MSCFGRPTAAHKGKRAVTRISHTATTGRGGLLLLLISAVCAYPIRTLADAGSDQGGQLYSIEKRRLMGTHELSASIGSMPIDAFGKGLSIQGNYTFHFTHLIAWEVVGGTYSFIIGTGLDDDLRERFDAQSEKSGSLVGMIHSDFVLKPLYGKLAWFNDNLLAAEMFFVAGPALGFFDDDSRPIGANLGVGIRLFLGKYFSVRLDLRDYAFFPGFSDVSNHVYISLGIGLTFGFDSADTTAENENPDDA